MIKIKVLLFINVFLLSTVWAKLPDALLINKSRKSNIFLEYFNIYAISKNKLVLPNEKFIVSFTENTYQPTLLAFVTRAPGKESPLLAPGQFLIEQPVLVMLPGDTIAVEYDEQKNTFVFTGRNQIELDFYKKIWKNPLSLSGFYFEMNVPATKIPLDQFLKKWYQLKLEGEALIAELSHTSGVRPAIAAFLARQLRLRIFTILVLPADYQRPRDSLRVFTKAYTDSVAVEARILSHFQNSPATSTEGLIKALSAYAAYKCVQARQYPTCKAKYLLAKKEFSGFQRAWVCFNILQIDGLNSHKNISWLLQDYVRWVEPYEEFVRVLKGDPTVPLRSYKGVMLADLLTNSTAQQVRLTDLLAGYKGHAVLLDLWASWCVPCLEELPASVAAGSKYKTRGLVVIYLSIDESPNKWQQALKRLPKGAQNHFRFTDAGTSAFLKEFEVGSIPRYLLIDRNGIIRYPNALRPSDPRFKEIVEKVLLL